MSDSPRQLQCDSTGAAPIDPATGRAVDLADWWGRRHMAIAIFALLCIGVYLALRYWMGAAESTARWWLWMALGAGGGPLVVELVIRHFQRRFGSDLLAGISIVTSVLLGEYVAGTLVVLMLSGGAALESFAVRRASSVLDALARRMPSLAQQ